MFSSLPSGRVTTTPVPNGIRIAIRPQRDWRIAFFFVWLTGWTIGPWKMEMKALETLRDPSSAQWFNLLWGIGWIFGIVAVSGYILWAICGLETICVTHSELTLSKTVFGLPLRAWNMHVTDARNLRFSPAYGSGKRRVASRIAFEYGTKTISFGAELEDGEALATIDSMLEVYAFPKRDRSLEYIELSS